MSFTKHTLTAKPSLLHTSPHAQENISTIPLDPAFEWAALVAAKESTFE